MFLPTILNYLNDREMGRHYHFLGFQRPPKPPPPPPNPKIFTILMTEMRDVIIFVGFWGPPICPPSLTPQYLTILVTVRGGAVIFCRILPPPPPDATILNHLNDRERGAPLFFVGFWRPPMTSPPPPDATILNYLNDRKRRGAIIIL